MTYLTHVLTRDRYRALAILLLVFIAFNSLVRVGLLFYNGNLSLLFPWRVLPMLAIGALFDAGVGLCILTPFALLVAAWSPRPGRALWFAASALLLPLCWLMAFVGLAEFTFWNEFASRFNFIAVDYLIYTSEVIGNIRESYNLPLLLGIVTLTGCLIWLAAAYWIRRPLTAAGSPRRAAWLSAAVWIIAPVIAMAALDTRYKDFSPDAQLNELAGDGYYDFWHAFRTNEIDYDRFYRTLPHNEALRLLTTEIYGKRALHQVSQRPYERDIAPAGPARRLNVVLVSIESLGAEFLAAFGNQQRLTPNLDRMANEGMLFTRLYATGTRTVRGLEALTLSVPPTPGHSIVKRPHNDNLFTVGEVFREQGYESLYLYGGYGYFDNMNAFFGGNGYTVIDRTALSAEDIHFENVWGVADEDLFAMTLRELDARDRAGKPFFAHVMTTSNHRPFTYPEGRIDIPSKSGREGGVKYTDYAIGRFMEAARTRPWFANTMFVFVADHTHKGRGRVELPVENYHIPMIIYAPDHIAPRRIETIASQIDVAPTILGLLNFRYRSRFFGQDILVEGQEHQRALLANYQTVGYYEQGRIVELRPNGYARVVDATTGREAPKDEITRELIDDAISYYQLSSEAYRRGDLKMK